MKKLGIALALATFAAHAASGQENYPYCQILDRVDVPAWEVHAGYDTQAEPQNSADEFSVSRVNGGGGLLYLRGDYGALDITGNYDARFFSGDGGIGLPDNVYDLHLGLAYIARNMNGQAARIAMSPGFYSELGDISTDDSFIPFDVRGIQTINEQFSLYLGVAVFPGFEETIDPRFGARYAPTDEWLLDIAYPESRVTYSPQPELDIYAGIKGDQTSEWKLDDDNELDTMRYNEIRAYLGVEAPIAEDLRLLCQAGGVFDRSFDFEDGFVPYDIDDAWFISIGLGSALE